MSWLCYARFPLGQKAGTPATTAVGRKTEMFGRGLCF
jgi:hypothetical protein